jgi:transposase InsO family protein
VGLAALAALFRGLPRCLLQDLLRRYRRVWRWRYRQHGFRLEWHQPGRVWAIDFSEALYPIDGVYPYLFAVRDLASHEQLAWHPLRSPSAAEALVVLLDLFVHYGPPLLIKSDNGSAFVAELFQQALALYHVLPLFSPPRHPQYNGALERSNGTLKTYTHQHAVHEGHAFRWTSDDVEHARQLANTLSRPWGPHGATPEEAWQARTPISPEERRQFLDAVEVQRAQARRDLGLAESAALSHFDQARLDRLALTRALVQLGYLTLRRADRPPKKPRRLSRKKLARRAQRHLDRVLATPVYAWASAGCPLDSSDAGHEPAPALASGTHDISALSWSTTGEDAGGPNHPFALFPPDTHATMTILRGVAAFSPEIAPSPPPARVERANASWFRRSITLLLSFVKAAMIS